MEQLARGQRLPLDTHAGTTIAARLQAQDLPLDYLCFSLDAAGRLADERYMTFFNQPVTPCGAIRLADEPDGGSRMVFDLAALPAWVERVVIAACVDGAGDLSRLGSGSLALSGGAGEFARFPYAGSDFLAEKAVMLGEFYRRAGTWRFMAVGQGFNSGLDALVRHFGGEVAEPAPGAAIAPSSVPAPSSTPTPKLAPAPAVSLEKKIEAKAPALVSLVKSAGVSLVKAGMTGHRARVCLVLDISGSMNGLYKSGAVQKFAERILALGCRFDDDGAIDVFLFGRNAHECPPMGLGNWSGYVQEIIKRHPLEGDTCYAKAMQAVRRHYFPDCAGGERSRPVRAELPVYVMFVTDGGTSDKPKTECQLCWSSHEPIFWQFMGIGKGRKSKSKALAAFGNSDFPFLEKLDELDGRLVDNAGFFSVSAPDEHGDAALYDLLLDEYPAWVKLARVKGMLP